MRTTLEKTNTELIIQILPTTDEQTIFFQDFTTTDKPAKMTLVGIPFGNRVYFEIRKDL